MFSQRSGRSRALNALAVRLAEMPPPRFDLSSSNPTAVGVGSAELLRLVESAVANAHQYRPEALGLTSARRAVAGHWAASRAVPPPAEEDVLLTASTSEAYSFAFKLLCDAGDEVLVPAPSYPLFEHLAELELVKAVPYRLAYDGAWHIDLDSLARCATPRARAVIVVSPNNPTGHYATTAQLEDVAELGLPILSDEVFYEYPLLPVPPPRLPSHVLSLRMGGLSKLAALPQLKLAWTILSGPAHLRQEARERLELIADTFLSVGSPVQLALPALLQAAPAVTAAIGARCRDNLRVLRELTTSSPLTLLRAEGGWSAVVRVPRVASEDDLVCGLLDREGVLVQPGWFYDFEQPGFLVLSLLAEPYAFREAAARLVGHVTRTCA